MAGVAEVICTAAVSAASRSEPRPAGIPEELIHGRGAASDGRRAAHPSHLLDDTDLHCPEPEFAVAQSCRRGGIGHQGHPLGSRRLDSGSQYRGVDVNTVGDQLDGHPRVLEQRKDRPGLAVMHRPHRVEQVRADGRTEFDGPAGLFVRRVRMSNGDNHSGIDEADNRLIAAGAFRCQGDHPDCAVSGGQ